MELKPYEKYFLDIKEAAEYYGIGLKKVRRLAEDGMGRYAILCGNRYLIVRTKFEEFIETTMLSGTPGNLGAEGDKDSDL